MPERVILDCDPGIDDALAILFALRSPELKVEAVTAVSGNLTVDRTSENALKILELAGRIDVPVAKGMERPLVRELFIDFFSHGKDGLGETNLPRPSKSLSPLHAVDLMVETIESNPRDITIITTGPLTNLAMVLMKASGIADKVRRHVMMGGLFGVQPHVYRFPTGGNPVSEWNVFVDPEAAKIVFNSGLRTTAVGLDVTTLESVTVTEAHLKRLRKAGTREALFSAQMMEFIMKRGFPMHLHDPMAVGFAVNGGLFESRTMKVDVETEGLVSLGQTVTDHRLKFGWDETKPKIDVVTDVNAKGFLDTFFERVSQSG